MGIVKKISRVIKEPAKIIVFLNNHGFYWLFSDKRYLKILFKYRLKKSLDLKAPKTFNEKMQWLKLNNRKKAYINLVDKYEVKQIISSQLGEEYVIPTIGVWKKFDEIDFELLPEQFVLKSTHDSGGLVICKDKRSFDYLKAKVKIEKSLRRNYYWHGREWPYRYVEPRIIAEPFLFDPKKPEAKSLLVYKFMCFGGVPRIVQTIQNDKTPYETIDYFDVEWNLLDLRQNFPNSEKPLCRPHSFSKMLELATILSQGQPFLRVDFYEIDEKPIFSELTFFSDSGTASFNPTTWDQKLGDWIDFDMLER